jgi:hypothetical protein
MPTTPQSDAESPRRLRLRALVAGHVRAVVVDLLACRASPERAVSRLVQVADMYATEVAAANADAGDD